MSGDVCDVCEAEPTVGVASVPGVPISVAYCRKCLEANAHPWWVLVANTACMGGLQNADRWWVEMVEDTCRHLGQTRDLFEADVATAIAAEATDADAAVAAMAEQEREEHP